MSADGCICPDAEGVSPADGCPTCDPVTPVVMVYRLWRRSAVLCGTCDPHERYEDDTTSDASADQEASR